jgi:2-keto-4-pentenoate hydratase
MPQERPAAVAARLVAARRRGERIALTGAELPADYEEGFSIQDRVVTALNSPIIGWKVMQVPQGPVIFAPLLQPGRIAAFGSWAAPGREPAGIELEIGFLIGRDLPKGASRVQVLDAVAAAHVAFELCQSRIADPEHAPRHVMLADCIANAGVVVGPEIANWRSLGLAARRGRFLVDGHVHAEGQSIDPVAALQLLPPALERRGKRLLAGHIVITGSLIGMNWLAGRHDLKGIIDGCGEVAMTLLAAQGDRHA